MTKKDTQNAGNIVTFSLQSNKSSGKIADLAAGIVDFRYYESILSNTVSATATVLESGYQVKGNKAKGKGTILDNLPVRGGERARIIIEDAKGKELDLPLYVNRVRDVDPGTQKDIYFIDFAPAEFFANEQTRVVRKYTGKISSHVNDIMQNVLKSGAKLDVDNTGLNYNFIGNDRKPLYTITWLASKSVPINSGTGKGNSIGGAAGFLFFQTHDKFNFVSIDRLFKSKPKAKYIYNNVDVKPSGYNDKILSYKIKSDVDLQQNLTMGVYNNRSMFFDFYAMNYKVVDYNVTQQEGKIFNAAPYFAPDRVAKEFTQSPTRLMTHVLDSGAIMKGDTQQKQLNQPVEPNFDAENTMVQSIMRYNQMFSIQVNVTVPGNFNLRAGQTVYCDFPGIEPGSQLSENSATGGIYIIAHLCHKITPTETYTSLSLVRDSFNDK